MIMYYHIKLGETKPCYGLGMSLIAIKDLLTHYPSASGLKLPRDAYTNDAYHLYDYNLVKRLQESGIIVYWANVYDSHLNTSTPFMIFYIDQENDSVVPIFILAPPSMTPEPRNGSGYDASMDTVVCEKHLSKSQKKKLRLRMEMERRSLR